MNKIKALIIFFLFNICCCWGQSDSSFIGVVDFNALVLLHPKMADYIPEEKAFNIESEQIKKDLDKIDQKELKRQIEKLNFEIKGAEIELSKEQKKVQEILSKKTNDFTSKLVSITDPLKREEETRVFNKEKNSIEEQFLKYRQSKQQFIDKRNDELAELQRQLAKPGLTSKVDTENIFKSISNEIVSFIKTCSNKHKLKVVLSSSNERFVSNCASSINAPLPPDFTFKKILNAKNDFITEKNQKHPEFNKTSEMFYQNIIEDSKIWLSYESELLSDFSSNMLEGSVVLGGTDITSEVLSDIFSKYNVDINIANAIKKAVEE